VTILALVLVAAAVIVIGLGVSLAALPPGAVSLATRIASVFGLGCATVMFAGTLLVVAGLFTPVALTLVLAAVTGASYVVALRRGSPREHVDSVREELASDRVWLPVGLAVLVLVAVAWLSIPEFPLHGTWRYWADGLEVADVGGMPEASAQWGGQHPPDTSKIGASAFLGALSFVFREEPNAAMALALWLSTVGYAAALLALGRELGLRLVAPALPLLAIAGSTLPGGFILNEEIAWKLTFFQNEDLGRMLAAVAAVLIVASSSERSSLGRMVAGGVVLAAGALAHLIPAVAFGALIAGVVLARLVLDRRRRVVAYAAAALAVAGVMTFVPLALASGDVSLQGAGDSGRYTLYEGKYDPTAMVKGMSRQPREKSERRFYEPPVVTMHRSVEIAVGRELTRAAAVGLGLVCALAAVGAFAFGSREIRLLVAGASVMAAAILAIALLFSYRYSLYIPATFGRRRLFEYLPIPVTLLAFAVVEVIAARVELRRAPFGRALAAAFVAAVVIGTASGSLGAGGSPQQNRYVDAAVLTPCDSRLLVDRDTRGSFQALTGRISVTEGLLPFLRPSIVNDVLRLREEVDRFFADPSGSAAVLRDEEVDYVIAERSPALDSAEGLRRVGTADDLGVYEVESSSSSRERPRPTGSAGYHCFRTVSS
jgi:hypothetical protein